MALNANIHWGLILRVNVHQHITQDGWKFLLSHARFPFNFDGEIYGLGFGMEEELLGYGFRGPEAGEHADYVDVDHGYQTAVNQVNWLELVDVVPIVSSVDPFKAWKLKKSGVFTVGTVDDQLVMKGTEVDWSPLVSAI